jgi:homoprotocatechuate degradation regulator HpaR
VTAAFREHVAAAGLTLEQWRVIRALASGEKLDTTTLSKRCVILPPSLTRIINYLLAEGLVAQVPAPDRRQRVIRISDKGRRCFDKVWVVSQQKYAHIENKFGRDELRTLVTSLNRLRETLEGEFD